MFGQQWRPHPLLVISQPEQDPASQEPSHQEWWALDTGAVETVLCLAFLLTLLADVYLFFLIIKVRHA